MAACRALPPMLASLGGAGEAAFARALGELRRRPLVLIVPLPGPLTDLDRRLAGNWSMCRALASLREELTGGGLTGSTSSGSSSR